jgi:hypothetical protein
MSMTAPVDMAEMLRRMYRIRRFDEAAIVLLDVLELEDARRPGDDHEEGTGP